MSESISLGWNCSSATYGVQHQLRTTKKNGYKTCPFDEMITNYQGIVQCFLDNFQYLCDTKYLEIIQIDKSSKYLNTNGDGDMIIYNKKYNFLFNHESPGHANLYNIQGWTKGINHYVMDNYSEFIQRYNRRIENIQELLHSDKFIHFILSRPNTDASTTFSASSRSASELCSYAERSYIHDIHSRMTFLNDFKK